MLENMIHAAAVKGVQARVPWYCTTPTSTPLLSLLDLLFQTRSIPLERITNVNISQRGQGAANRCAVDMGKRLVVFSK